MTKNQDDIKNKILNSDSIKSLIIESSVYKVMKRKGWETEHSPYFKDINSNKLRELDVKARKYFKSNISKYSCDIDILVECKSLKNYHIIANNKTTYKSDFDFIWTGNYTDKNANKLDGLMLKYNFNVDEIKYIKEKLEEYCFPEITYRWLEYKVEPFDIPKFNAYRETNINTTKDIENSVIWKCIMSLQNAIVAHEELLLNRIEESILESIHQDSSRLRIVELLIDNLINDSNHIFFIHPIIVVESSLWEFTNKQDLNKLKYFRLNIQKLFEDNFWVDIVSYEYLEEYLNKSKKYIDFHNKKEFKNQ